MPKKMKLDLSKKNVLNVIKRQTEINIPMRFMNLTLKSLELLASPKDIPEIVIKLAPMH